MVTHDVDEAVLLTDCDAHEWARIKIGQILEVPTPEAHAGGRAS